MNFRLNPSTNYDRIARASFLGTATATRLSEPDANASIIGSNLLPFLYRLCGFSDTGFRLNLISRIAVIRCLICLTILVDNQNTFNYRITFTCARPPSSIRRIRWAPAKLSAKRACELENRFGENTCQLYFFDPLFDLVNVCRIEA